MAKLTFQELEKTVKTIWSGPNSPELSIEGMKVRLTYSPGKYVDFLLTRADLLLSADQFNKGILEPAVESLRKLVT